MLEKETIAVEFWRQRYVRQAVMVTLLFGGLAFAAVYFFEFFFTRLLCIAIALLLSYLMLKELREDLQTRGEAICTASHIGVYGDLRFDVGRGIDEKIMDNLQSVTEYQVRECRNVMYQDGMSIEEDIFYNIGSAKFAQLQQMVFEGVVLTFDLKNSVSSLRGEAACYGKKTIVSGEIASFLHQDKILQSLSELMMFFKAEQTKIEMHEDKIYFFMPTKIKIFFQFSLFKRNRAEYFANRVLLLKAKTESLYNALNG